MVAGKKASYSIASDVSKNVACRGLRGSAVQYQGLCALNSSR